MLRNAVVSGANRGLGLEICRQLLSSKNPPYDCVYALCRQSSPELDALAAAATTSDDGAKRLSIVSDIDLVHGGYESTLKEQFTQDGTPTPIALLIHNAGAYGPSEDFADPSQVYSSQSLENITPERLLYAFQLNSAAPLFLTKQLLPNLRANNSNSNNDVAATASTKVIIISSLMGSIADNTSGGHYGYRAAKAAVNMIGKSLSADLTADQVAVGLVHPGFVHTGFGTGPGQPKRPGQRDVVESVQGVLQAVDCVTMETTGRFWHGNYAEGVKELAW